MKAKRFLTHAIAIIASLLAFTSCDPDVDKSMVLAGEWEGDFGVYYTYRTQTGRLYDFYAEYTRLTFYPHHDHATYGDGKEYDYYREGPYEYETNYFLWEIKHGDIYLDYPQCPELNTVIYKYDLNNDIFSGRKGDVSERFYMRKIADFYEWTPDVNYHSYGNRDNWGSYYHARTRDGKAIEAPVTEEEGTIIKHGNRFADK